MTLTEYLNQDDPKRMPDVQLEDHEVEFGYQMMLAGEAFIREIRIPKLYETYKTSGTYIQKNRSATLWARDEDGNPSARSCFSLINPYAGTNN